MKTAALCLCLALAHPCASFAAYVPPAPTLARAITPAEAAALIAAAPPGATVSAPAAVLKPATTTPDNATALAALAAVIADTRANIPETATLTDLQVAALYLAQMQRDVSAYIGRVPTNTVEYLIGAGVRQSIAEGGADPAAASRATASEDPAP